MAKPHFTIFSGPPRSGKSTYTTKLYKDQEIPDFIVFEGNNSPNVTDAILAVLEGGPVAVKYGVPAHKDGMDVIFETTDPISKISALLLNRVDTIEIFRHDPNFIS